MSNPNLKFDLHYDQPVSTSPSSEGQMVTLRKFPYPFRAALTICSDIDGTTTLDRFLAIQNFLNKKRWTTLGDGIGLEIGNSFFPYTTDDSFAFFSSRKSDQELIITLIKSGYIDCLHSYGDGATSRDQMERALEIFERNDCRLDVWTDHSRAPSNFGKDTTPGEGDVPGSSFYHADITLRYGIRFIWKGRGSSIIGHGVPFSLDSFRRLFDRKYPARTGVNIARELMKIALANLGNKRFAIHRGNRLLRVAHLGDGQRAFEFQRCNNHWQGLSYGHNIEGLAYVIRPKALMDLMKAGGTMIIYTHLGVGPNDPPYIPQKTKEALIGLSNAYYAGNIYVTTTSRLLNYSVNRDYLNWSYEMPDHDFACISINGVDDPISGFRKLSREEAQGITFYIPDRQKVKILLAGEEVTSVQRNLADHTGRESVSIPRTFLTYPL